MKYSAQQYGTALADLLSESSPGTHKTIMKNFATLLVQAGAVRLLPTIARSTEQELRKKTGGKSIHIEAPNEESAHLAKKATQPIDSVSIDINPTLVGGVRITIDGKRIDTTLRRRFDTLTNLFN